MPKWPALDPVHPFLSKGRRSTGLVFLLGTLWLTLPSLAAASLPWLKVSADGKAFIAGRDQQPFHPRGFNYDRDYKMRLLEEYWDSEWDTVAEDFREMKALGANVVRIHLQLPQFMDSATQPNRHAVKQLKKLLRLAEKTGVYLDLTGLACYRKAAVPAWLSALNETERWDVQARFWATIAKTCADSPAVFCYDLINEPVVPAGKSADWLVGELAGFYYVQAICLDRGDRSRADVAVSWTAKMRESIRRHDKKHFITVGLLPDSADSPSSSGFLPDRLAPLLDFVCVHLYPHTGQLEGDLATLRKFAVGKPLVIEETFPLGCSSVELKTFLERAEPIANGWISFYWGETPKELEHSKSIAAAILFDWLKQVAAMTQPRSATSPR